MHIVHVQYYAYTYKVLCNRLIRKLVEAGMEFQAKFDLSKASVLSKVRDMAESMDDTEALRACLSFSALECRWSSRIYGVSLGLVWNRIHARRIMVS